MVLVLALAIPLTQYESFLLLIGAFFVPLLGVLAADYFVARHQKYVVPDLYESGGQYGYQMGLNLEALAVWFVGIAVYLGVAGLPLGFGDIVAPWLGRSELSIGGVAPWLGGTLPSLAVSFALHAILGRAAAKPAHSGRG